jgi:hypothetical protein
MLCLRGFVVIIITYQLTHKNTDWSAVKYELNLSK